MIVLVSELEAVFLLGEDAVEGSIFTRLVAKAIE